MGFLEVEAYTLVRLLLLYRIMEFITDRVVIASWVLTSPCLGSLHERLFRLFRCVFASHCSG